MDRNSFPASKCHKMAKNAIRERDSSKQWFYEFGRLGNVSILIWTRETLKNILRENPISGWSGRVLGTCLSKLKALGCPWTSKSRFASVTPSDTFKLELWFKTVHRIIQVSALANSRAMDFSQKRLL